MATATTAKKASATYAPRLLTEYKAHIVTDLQKELGLGNVHQVPKLEKIVVNIGLGRAKDEKKSSMLPRIHSARSPVRSRSRHLRRTLSLVSSFVKVI